MAKPYVALASASALAAALAAALWVQRASFTEKVRERPYRTTVAAPPPVRPPTTPSPPLVAPSSTASLPPSPFAAAEINLAVPFTPQAPFANWEQPYQDACEEAAVLMVERFWKNSAITALPADEAILKMVKFQEEHFGFYKASNTAETARWAELYYPHLDAETSYDVTVNDISAALDRGFPVIVLVNGQRLGNPFYTQPGPDKHALVIKGKSGQSFITNDPGTRRGADFVYPQAKLLDAMTDYDGATPGTHTKAMILLAPRSLGEVGLTPRAS